MSKSNAFETDFLKLIFQNIGIAGVGDATGIPGSATAGSLFPGIYTADPGEAGDQTTNEISYAPYARPPVARSTGGWVVSGNSVSPVATISFPQMTSGSGGVASFWGVGKSVSGPGEVLYSGAISPAITVAVNVTAQLNTATAITED